MESGDDRQPLLSASAPHFTATSSHLSAFRPLPGARKAAFIPHLACLVSPFLFFLFHRVSCFFWQDLRKCISVFKKKILSFFSFSCTLITSERWLAYPCIFLGFVRLFWFCTSRTSLDLRFFLSSSEDFSVLWIGEN
jgi:hypothetical protein